MRRLVLITGFLVWGWGTAHADSRPLNGVRSEERPIFEGMAAKGTRGLVNFTLGWIEVPKQIYLVGHHEGWLVGVIRGPIDGLGMFIARTVAGAYELLTFPIPLPPQYQPMVKPDYVWQDDPAEAPASSLER